MDWTGAGTVGGFHYGTLFRPCNGLVHATTEAHTDGRQVYVCDACGAKVAMRPEEPRKEDEDGDAVQGGRGA